MSPTALDTLIRQVTAYFRRHAAQYGLIANQVQARYILNWGGFVNASFFIKDGVKTLHVKLTDDEDAWERLARWQQFAPRLSEHYHAPRMIGWIEEIPRSDFSGAVFEYFPGRPADLLAQSAVLQGVLEMLPRLHADSTLRAALIELDGSVPTCAEYFLDVYIDRLDQDLLEIADELPPFVSLELLSWMMGETRELEGLAHDLPVFQQPAAAPTHGDLYASNILVDASGNWAVIDWDDLSLGDPALEYSILLGPLWRQGAISMAEAERLLPPSEDLRARFQLCLRALVLDEIIDSLADWIEARFAPDHQAEVRAAKEKVHREALELYQRLGQPH